MKTPMIALAVVLVLGSLLSLGQVQARPQFGGFGGGYDQGNFGGYQDSTNFEVERTTTDIDYSSQQSGFGGGYQQGGFGGFNSFF